MSRLKEMLIRHEGKRNKPYRDTVGKLTIGCGRNLDDLGVTESEIDFMLENDLKEVRYLMSGVKTYHKLDEVRQDVILNMCFNMGFNGLMAFRKMWEALDKGDFDVAASEMLSSRWASQVKGRAVELAKMMRNGSYSEPL